MVAKGLTQEMELWAELAVQAQQDAFIPLFHVPSPESPLFIFLQPLGPVQTVFIFVPATQ